MYSSKPTKKVQAEELELGEWEGGWRSGGVEEWKKKLIQERFYLSPLSYSVTKGSRRPPPLSKEWHVCRNLT